MARKSTPRKAAGQAKQPPATQPKGTKPANTYSPHLETVGDSRGARRGSRAPGSPEGGARESVASQHAANMKAGGYQPMQPDPATLYGSKGRTVTSQRHSGSRAVRRDRDVG
jgi:hypothetical protein